jgi:hypothetical protein
MKKEFCEGYRLTRTANGLVIEVLDYHARPLRLSDADLAELGLGPIEPLDGGAQPGEAPANRSPAARA